jgi:hypothetical protein
MLPKDYEIPQGGGNYMRLQRGDNRFYVMSEAIVGYQYWNKDNRPVRQREKFTEIPQDIQYRDGKPTDIKHFWAFVVWNYGDSALQILEITQSSIQREMKIKIDNRRGDVSKYDFIITKTGEGLGTEYSVDLVDHEPIEAEGNLKVLAQGINLEALFEGGDPFSSKGQPVNRVAVTPDPMPEIDVSDIPF